MEASASGATVAMSPAEVTAILSFFFCTNSTGGHSDAKDKLNALLSSLALELASGTGGVLGDAASAFFVRMLGTSSGEDSNRFLCNIVEHSSMFCAVVALLRTWEEKSLTPSAAVNSPFYRLLAWVLRALSESELISSNAPLQSVLLGWVRAANGTSAGEVPIPRFATADITLQELEALLAQQPVRANEDTVSRCKVASTLLVRQYLRIARSAAEPVPVATAIKLLRCSQQLNCGAHEALLGQLLQNVMGVTSSNLQPTDAASVPSGITVLVGLLLDFSEHGSSSAVQSRWPLAGPAGLLIDFITSLDPDATYGPSGAASHSWLVTACRPRSSCRPRHLISTVVDGAGWPTLHAHLTSLLGGAGGAALDSKLVLDIATSCMRLPRSWLGSREPGKGSGGFVPSTVEVAGLAYHTVKEMTAAWGAKGDLAAQNVLRNRLPLLLCGANTAEKGKEVIAHLELATTEELTPPGGAGPNSAELLARHRADLVLQLYISSPQLSRQLPTRLLNVRQGLSTAPSSLDVVMHKLIIALLEIRPEEVPKVALKEERTERAYRIFRNLATAYPLRVLRCMPTISVSGYSQYLPCA